jgi:DNA polymerase-3 subunit alpha
MPDIDMDFQDDRRDQVISYVTRRYGKDKVAQIITFGTMGPKAAIRDVGRAMGMSYSDTDRIAKLIPFKVRTLDDAIKVVPELADMYSQDEAMRTYLDNAKGLEGIPHHVSTHAAGVVISENPLADYIPLQRPVRGDESSEIAMTQFAMSPIAKLGLLKMDFLGLTNLTILDKTLKMLEQTRGLKLVLQQIPMDDEKTFQLLSSGLTSEVFQLESAGMQRNIKELKPSSLGDVAAMIALYRPGPMEQIPTFIEAKHGRSPVRSPHPSLDEILKDSYGVIVYQDQVLLILQTFAGYSLGEADIVRKAMGKKIPELMHPEREKFLEGAQKRGFSLDLAGEVFDLIEPFAGYAFNKAHSVSYALISYWTGYFKANYPLEYMASVLNARMNQTEKMTNAINECIRMGISILPPDVSQSEVGFSIDQDKDGQPGIRFGLAAIKNLGEGAIAPLIATRKESGPYQSLDDFCRRANCRNLNRRALESMIKAGAFDSLGKRGAVLDVVEQILAQIQMEARMRDTGQTSLFQTQDSGSSAADPSISLGSEDAVQREKVAWEKELLGVSITYNPMKALVNGNGSRAIAAREQIDLGMEGQKITILGHLSSAQERRTRDNRPYVSASLELLGGSLEVLAWPQTLERTQNVWQEGALLLVTGKVVVRGDKISIYCDDARPYEAHNNATQGSNGGQKKNTGEVNRLKNGSNGDKAPSRTLVISLEESDNREGDANLLRDLVETILEYPGDDRVHLDINTQGRMVRLDMPISANYCSDLERRLDDLLGPGKVSVAVNGNGNGNGVPAYTAGQ